MYIHVYYYACIHVYTYYLYIYSVMYIHAHVYMYVHMYNIHFSNIQCTHVWPNEWQQLKLINLLVGWGFCLSSSGQCVHSLGQLCQFSVQLLGVSKEVHKQSPLPLNQLIPLQALREDACVCRGVRENRLSISIACGYLFLCCKIWKKFLYVLFHSTQESL